MAWGIGFLVCFSQAEAEEAEKEPLSVRAMKLLGSAAGLQGSYLTWGVIQERIMTHTYGESLTKHPHPVYISLSLFFYLSFSLSLSLFIFSKW